MNKKLNRGAIAALATASLVATNASASQHVSVKDLGSAKTVRTSIINNFDSSSPSPYAGEHKEGEAKCGEGKCGEGKCGDGDGGHPETTTESKDDTHEGHGH